MVGERKGIMQSSSIIHINLLPPFPQWGFVFAR